MGIFKRKNKEEEAKKEQDILAQDIMPLEAIQGVFMRVTGGLTNIAIKLEGTNDSLYTYDQKQEEATSLAGCLRGVTCPISILKLPKAIDANASLLQVDSEISLLREALYNCNDETRAKVMEKRLDLLEQRIRPEAEMEALAGDRVEYPTYIIMQFDSDKTDSQALQDASIFVDLLLEAGRNAHVCQTQELVEMLQLYFTPRSLDGTLVYGLRPVFAKEAANGVA